MTTKTIRLLSLIQVLAVLQIGSVRNRAAPRWLLRRDVPQVQPRRGPTDRANIKRWINTLSRHDWDGPAAINQPLVWMFDFTPPMRRILEYGPEAQDALLAKLAHPNVEANVRAQIIILLGGIGDERCVGPIIASMVDSQPVADDSESGLVNLSASLALTNITTAPIIWNIGGLIPRGGCLDTPKECWTAWWEVNKFGFMVKGLSSDSRNFSNYPNYGIHRRP